MGSVDTMARRHVLRKRLSAVRLATCFLAVAGFARAAVAQPVVETERYSVTLASSEFYAREMSQIEFRIVDKSRRDADGSPASVAGATIHCSITMPDMPGMAAFEEAAHSEGSPGVYGVHPDFQHGGSYRLVLSLYEQTPGSLFSYKTIEFAFALTVNEREGGPQRVGRVRTYSLQLDDPPKPVVAGVPTTLRMRILREVQPERAETGAFRRSFMPVTDFEIRHERLAHLFFVRGDLGDFAHEHPTVAADGTMTLEHTFAAAGTYRLFADVTPRGAGGQVVDSTIMVGGSAAKPFDLRSQPTLRPGSETALGPFVAKWQFGVLAPRKTSLVSASVLDPTSGRKVDLERYLGASGHLMLIHEDGETFVHAHPDDAGPPVESGQVSFVTWLPKSGLYRGWAQFQRGGVVYTTAVVLRVD